MEVQHIGITWTMRATVILGRSCVSVGGRVNGWPYHCATLPFTTVLPSCPGAASAMLTEKSKVLLSDPENKPSPQDLSRLFNALLPLENSRTLTWKISRCKDHGYSLMVNA